MPESLCKLLVVKIVESVWSPLWSHTSAHITNENLFRYIQVSKHRFLRSLIQLYTPQMFVLYIVTGKHMHMQLVLELW